MQGSKKHILSTRLLRGAKTTEAEAAGLVIEQRSFIETVPAWTESILEKLEDVVEGIGCMVFTSSAAVKALQGIQRSQLGWPIYCTAPATSETVTALFGQESIRGTAPNARSLARLMVNDKIAGKVIFFCGNEHREELPQILRENGMEVNEVIVYETVLKPATIKEGFEGILFFSPSAVKSFFMNNQVPEKTVLFAIGETTAEELRQCSNNELLVAPQPSEDSLLQLAIDRFKI